MTAFIIDAYAWIEYVIGSEKGRSVGKIVENRQNEIITIECTLAELKSYALRYGKSFDELLELVEGTSQIVDVNRQNWIDAASIRTEMRKERQKFGLIDALLLAKQKEFGKGKVVSGDKHFDGLPNCIFLAEN